MSLTESEDRNPYLIVGLLCRLRYEGISVEQIARKLRFDSVEDMRIQMEIWQIPGWLHGVEPAGTSSTTPKQQKDRKPHGRGGGAEELPTAADANDLFQGR
jgi:hypothetical protein